MTTMRYAACAAAVALALSGCSAAGSNKEGPAMTSSTPSGSASDGATGGASSAPAVTGQTETLSVASVVVPDGTTWTKGTFNLDADTDELRLFAYSPTTGKQACTIVLTVQRPYPGTFDAYRAYVKTSGSETITTLEDDPATPQGAQGLVAHYAGGGSGGAAPYTSVLRSWLTPGRTLITLAVSSTDEMEKTCSPDGVAATLRWDGNERSASPESPS